MSTNLHKAQKHMQRATELLNRSQLGFGGPDGVKTRGQKRRSDKLKKQVRKKRTKKCIEGEFRRQIQGVCYMYSVYNLLLRRLLKDPALNSLKSVKRANEQLKSGSVLRVGRYTLEQEALDIYASLFIYWLVERDVTQRSDHEIAQLKLDANIPIYQKNSTARLIHGGSAGLVLQAIILATQEHKEIAVVQRYDKILLDEDQWLHHFTTVHCENGIASAKIRHTKSNYVETLKGIFENTYYDDKYIFFEEKQLCLWDYSECLQYFDDLPGEDRFAGAFIDLVYDFDSTKAYHSVCMIHTEEGFEVYNANYNSSKHYYDYLNDLQSSCHFEKIEMITYVYSPKIFSKQD